MRYAMTGNAKGFTLLEVAVALIVIGLTFSVIAAAIDASQERNKVRITHENMKTVIKALSTYAQSAHRLPCPADPAKEDISFGWEWGVNSEDLYAPDSRPLGACKSVSPKSLSNDTTGIVPYMTLNVPASAARDGWGRYFTYAVSPAFAQNNDMTLRPSWDQDFRVHGRCRTKAWVDETCYDGRNSGKNRNSGKARFCCAAEGAKAKEPTFPPATDIQIRLFAGASERLISPERKDSLSKESFYGGSDQLLPQMTKYKSFSAAPESAQAAAFVLLSHGANGLGAYAANGTRDQYGAKQAGKLERENFNMDRTYFTEVYAVRRGGKNNFFDDIVLWMTQDDIMAANGTATCSYP